MTDEQTHEARKDALHYASGHYAAYEQDDKDDKVLDLAKRYFEFLTGTDEQP